MTTRQTATTVDLDFDVVDLIAESRKEIHEQEGNHRPAYTTDSMTAERVGVAAEAAVALRYGLPAPGASRVGGDDGYDYRLDVDGETLEVEIKGSKYDDPSLMISDEYRGDADAYLLASVSLGDDVVLCGWLRDDQLEERGRREASKFGDMMTVVDGDQLDPIPDPADVSPADD